MTAVRLGTTATPSPQYAIVGKCCTDHAVSHVGVLVDATDLVDGQEAAVFHMEGAITGLRLPGKMPANAVGWIRDFTAEERLRVDRWLQRLGTATIKVEYSACPSIVIDKDKVTGRVVGKKYSCAGFVHCCFDEALGIKLVVHEEQLPEVPLTTLVQVWGAIVATPRGRRYLPGPGPWKVLLPSYLLHALTVGREAMPFRPTSAEPRFPPSA